MKYIIPIFHGVLVAFLLDAMNISSFSLLWWILCIVINGWLNIYPSIQEKPER